MRCHRKLLRETGDIWSTAQTQIFTDKHRTYSESRQKMYEKKNVGEINLDFRQPNASPVHSLEKIGFASKQTLHNQIANLHWFNFNYNITWMALSQYYSYC